MDMIWQGYQRRRVRKRAEWMHFSWTAELPSQSSRHDVSVSETKKGHGGQERQICGCMKTNLGFRMQLHSRWYVHISDHRSRGRLWSASHLPLGYKIGVLLKKLQMCYNILSSFYSHWWLNIWWAMASLLLILNKSESGVFVRVAFSISFAISPQIGEAINSLNF